MIGLDGTPASYLRRRIADGFLPNLAELSRQGTLMSARAPLPPISSVSWASASTGVNPGRHGVFGFVERKPGSWDLTFTNAFTISEPQVWAKAADAGMRSVVVNIPGTYPAQPNGSGVLVSGFVSPTLERSVQPPSLISFLQERDYLIDVDLGLGHKDLEAFCEQLFAHHAARTRVLVDLLDGEPCDLFYVAFTGTDRLHHFLWEQMEREEEPWAVAVPRLLRGRRRVGRRDRLAAARRLPADPALRPRLLPPRSGGVREPLAGAGRLDRARGAGEVDRLGDPRAAPARTAWIPVACT